MNAIPTKLERSAESELRIVWTDGQVRCYAISELRKQCPCATCREQRKAEPEAPPLLQVIDPREAAPLTIKSMKPVGAYAYSIEFSDGHDTGIYTFESLRSLGEVVAP